MTVREAIKIADAVAPNALKDDLKCQFLNEVEGTVMTEVMLLSPHDFEKYMLSGTYTGNVSSPDPGVIKTETPHGFRGAGRVTIGTTTAKGYVTDRHTIHLYEDVEIPAGEATIEFDGGDTVLLAFPPHDKIYWHYLVAMIHFANADYDRYQNTMQLYNESLGEFMRWYAQNYRPADR